MENNMTIMKMYINVILHKFRIFFLENRFSWKNGTVILIVRSFGDKQIIYKSMDLCFDHLLECVFQTTKNLFSVELTI